MATGVNTYNQCDQCYRRFGLGLAQMKKNLADDFFMFMSTDGEKITYQSLMNYSTVNGLIEVMPVIEKDVHSSFNVPIRQRPIQKAPTVTRRMETRIIYVERRVQTRDIGSNTDVSINMATEAFMNTVKQLSDSSAEIFFENV